MTESHQTDIDRPLTFLDMGSAEIPALIDDLMKAPKLAVDTESDSFHRYHEKICLIQLSTPARDYFFDPLAWGLPDLVRALLVDPNRTLVFHGADYDVRSFLRSFDLRLGRLFDTFLAAKVLGLTTLGLKSLLEAELGVVIEKKEQRSDWAKRPLTPAQLAYARQDTRWLLDLAERLIDKLVTAGRLAWVEEECERLRAVNPVEQVFDPEGWRTIKGAKKLPVPAQQVLRALYVWREEQASVVDVPPFRILRNEVMIRLAEVVGQSGAVVIARLDQLRFVPRHLDLSALQTVLRNGLLNPQADVGSQPPSQSASRPDRESMDRYDRLATARREWATSLQLDPGFLMPASVLQRLVRRMPSQLEELSQIEGMTRWRVTELGNEILRVLHL